MKFLLLLLSIAFLVACFPQKKKNPDKRLQDKDVPAEFEIGEAKDGIYTNNFFEFTFKYDTTWSVQSYEDLKKLMQTGQEMIAGDNKALQDQIEANQVRSASLFGTFKHNIDAIVESNPNLIIITENLMGTSVTYGDDYLEHLRDLWDEHQIGIVQTGAIRETPIDSKDFYRLEGEIRTPYGVGYQQYYCTVMKGFALVITISYTNDEEREELEKVISTIRFK